jgi:phospholipase C
MLLAVPPLVPRSAAKDDSLPGINHIVVIFEENRSFDNIYGGWPGVDGVTESKVRQVGLDGAPLSCLPQTDVNLTSPPLPVTCTATVGGKKLDSAFKNAPFNIDDYYKRDDATCPKPGTEPEHGVKKGDGLPGGCEADLVHKFYQEQYQINGGRMNRYVLGSDQTGLTVSYHDTAALPIYQYLHGPGAPRYAVADHFFHAAFGGSFLNHQWLIAAAMPVWPNAPRSGSDDQHSIVGPDGYPGKTLLHPQTPGTKDGALTQAANPDGSCTVPANAPTPPRATVCGDYPVNTVQPTYQPFKPGTTDAKKLPPQTNPTIGDRLSAKNVDWAYYSGGWDNASGNTSGTGWTNGSGPKCADAHVDAKAVYPYCPDEWFQYHHQPFNYYANFAPGTPARAAHLRDGTEFLTAAQAGQLKPVSFFKPIGQENEHPGYTNEPKGSARLVELVKAVMNGPQAADTMIVVTYDEHGGLWDHVPPPTGGSTADKWGPGTRIPAMVISPKLPKAFAVDQTSHDTTSVMATIEHKFGLQPVSSRDAAVVDLSSAFNSSSGTNWARIIIIIVGIILVAIIIVVLVTRFSRRRTPA